MSDAMNFDHLVELCRLTREEMQRQAVRAVDLTLVVRNFLLQATGSDMLRVACLLLEQAGIRVIATIHDAVLVECETRYATEVGKAAVEIMEDASRIVLWDRITVRVDRERFDHPHHFQDGAGVRTWRRLAALLGLPLDALDG